MAEAKLFVFRHKTIRRFSTAGFEFKNFELHIRGEEERDRFIKIVNDLPARDANQIVEVNLEARAASERSVLSPVVRGPLAASDILTQKDGQRITSGDPSASGNALGGTPAKPTGFIMPKLGSTT